MSRDRTTKSASFPAERLPFSFSSNADHAASAVYAFRASAGEIRCSGNHPPGFFPSMVRRVTAASIPAIGESGATSQSDPKASRAPASRSDRNAYVVRQRSRPIRFSAQRPSSIAWYGCIEAMTPSRANRGMSDGRRCCACSMRKRRSRGPFAFATRSKRSRISELARSPIAWITTWSPARSAPATRSSIREIGIASAAKTPAIARLVGIGLEEERRRRAEGAVRVPLHAADPEPLVVLHRRAAVSRLLPGGQRRTVVDAHRERARAPQRLPRVEISRVSREVLDGRHADARGMTHRGAQRLAEAPPACAAAAPRRWRPWRRP